MMHEGRPGRVREQPPRWSRRDEPQDRPESQRWLRDQEPYESGGLIELFAGAAAMEDVAEGADNLRILARYCVARLLALTMYARMDGTSLRIERRITLDHLALLPSHDWERRQLERLAGLCRADAVVAIMGPLITCAEAAAKRGHTFGAFELYRAGYDLARSKGWWGDAERAARGIARIAELDEARRSTRLWRGRAHVCGKRERERARQREMERERDRERDSLRERD